MANSLVVFFHKKKHKNKCIWWKSYKMTKFWSFLPKFAVLGQKSLFGAFFVYIFQRPLQTFILFVMKTIPMVFFENITKRMSWKNYETAKTWTVWPKILILSHLALYLPNAATNFPNFRYGNSPYGLFWEKKSVFMLGKFWDCEKIGFSLPKMTF